VLKPRRDDNQVGGNRRRDETDAPFSIGKLILPNESDWHHWWFRFSTTQFHIPDVLPNRFISH
jgi:hypothetical protein